MGVVLDGTDHFFRPIEAELNQRHIVERFVPRFVRLPLIGSRVNELLLVSQLRGFMNRQDIVFFEWAGPLAALASTQPVRSRRIVRAHRTEVLGESITDIHWEKVDRAIFVSGAMRSRFLNQIPISEGRSAVIHNGVDLRRFELTQRTFAWRIGMLGNLIPRKRIYSVICALSDLPKSIPWQLSLGGEPTKTSLDYWHALHSLVDRLEVADQVRFLGRIEDPSTWFRGIDVLISASFSEGQQVSLLEGMASGCYCLSHCWDGVEEVLPPENIFATDLQEKLLAYAEWPVDKKREGQEQMRAIAESKFDEQRMVGEILELVEQVAGS